MVVAAGWLAVTGAASASAAIIYDQNNNIQPGNISILSINPTGSPTLSAAAADDFTVPLGQKWRITGINVSGFQAGGAPTTETVTVSTDKGQHPFKARNQQTVVGADTAGSLQISLAPFALTAGHYWVSVVANTTNVGVQWYWDSRSVQKGSAAEWQNPGGGWGFGCLSWWYVPQCSNNLAGPDLMFSLTGKKVSLPRP